jgi:hypothetical protein
VGSIEHLSPFALIQKSISLNFLTEDAVLTRSRSGDRAERLLKQTFARGRSLEVGSDFEFQDCGMFYGDFSGF